MIGRLCACGHDESEHYKHQDWYTCGSPDGPSWLGGGCECDNFYPVVRPKKSKEATDDNRG